ncbi:GDP-L-fucose synthase family protein [Actinomycetes bacterium M1A6_2h]
MNPPEHALLGRADKIYVAGHRGLVGSAIWRELRRLGHRNLVGRTSSELDLRNRDDVNDLFRIERPDVVIMAAAKVGGIMANNTFPVDFLTDNLRVQVNVMDAALAQRTPRLLFLGSSCVYPRLAEQPIREDALMTGALEPTNDAYAIAKIAGMTHVRAVRRQYGLPWISAMPTNLYGPNDNFEENTSHLLPALIRRYDKAVREGSATVRNWGSGTVRRELMHVDDMASACIHLLEHYDDDLHVNVGTGTDETIRDLAAMVAASTGFRGTVEWDTTKPDGMPRKQLDTSLLSSLGWKPSIPLTSGIDNTVSWYRESLSR